MTIWDGGEYGTQVSPDLEAVRGAYTVANFNDTNSDQTTDDEQSPVVGVVTRDEIDLMKLVIAKPNPADPGSSVQLDYSGSLTLWTGPHKDQPFNDLSIPVDDLPMTLWVETSAASTSLGDQYINETYNEAIDTVLVTGIWASATAVYSQTSNAQTVYNNFDDMDGQLGPGINGLAGYIDVYGGTGNIPVDNNSPYPSRHGVHEGVLIQWTIQPSRGNSPTTWEQDGVMFDSARMMQFWWYRSNVKDAPFGDPLSVDFPRTRIGGPIEEEIDNDDSHQDDESDAVTSEGHFYSWDGPGISDLGTSAHSQYVYNMNEWLRVNIDGPRPDQGAGGTIQGSRCSPYQQWHAVIDAVKAADGSTVRNQPDPSNVGAGWIGQGPY